MMHAYAPEMPRYTAYIMKEIEKRELRLEHFLGKKGDVLIWHSHLYHGGAPIRDPRRTRKSMVTHYWRASDLPGLHRRVGRGRYYQDRPPLLGWV
jgi:ectoine hydroxylase-related dioxygenase (phytanoyl-CoA dioxygenase family)